MIVSGDHVGSRWQQCTAYVQQLLPLNAAIYRQGSTVPLLFVDFISSCAAVRQTQAHPSSSALTPPLAPPLASTHTPTGTPRVTGYSAVHALCSLILLYMYVRRSIYISILTSFPQIFHFPATLLLAAVAVHMLHCCHCCQRRILVQTEAPYPGPADLDTRTQSTAPGSGSHAHPHPGGPPGTSPGDRAG